MTVACSPRKKLKIEVLPGSRCCGPRDDVRQEDISHQLLMLHPAFIHSFFLSFIIYYSSH
jgi:hypothetical protein